VAYPSKHYKKPEVLTAKESKLAHLKNELKTLAEKYGIKIIYAFGSRAKEALEMLEGKREKLSPSHSDLDIGILVESPLTVDEKVEIAIVLEDLFDAPQVDLVILNDAPLFLALEIVCGELLYARDPRHEAEYQLFIMSLAAELEPYRKMREEMVLGG